MGEMLNDVLPKREKTTILEETFFNCMGRFAEAATKSDVILVDLHPGNVMRNRQGTWKIVDFEFARNGHAILERHRKGVHVDGEDSRPVWCKRRLTASELRDLNLKDPISETMFLPWSMRRLDRSTLLSNSAREMYAIAEKDEYLKVVY